MSGYNGRRGPNVSQYIAELNTIPSAQDLQQQNFPNVEEDLALFTNTDFLDFDSVGLGELPDLTQTPLDYDPAQEERARRQNASGYRSKQTDAGKGKDEFLNSNADFLNGGDFQFPGYNFPNLVDPSAAAGFQAHHPQQQQAQFNIATQPQSPDLISPISPTANAVGTKRKIDSVADINAALPGDDVSRQAAEEDKRRRNTAASARFRVKKKQREQALEKSAKEMTDKVTSLENKVSKLETENRWLKELLTEKSGKDMSPSKLYKDAAAVRSLGDHTTGVGTDAKEAKA